MDSMMKAKGPRRRKGKKDSMKQKERENVGTKIVVVLIMGWMMEGSKLRTNLMSKKTFL